MSHLLILGATSDIGKALAREYASNGYRLTLAARNPERLFDTVNDLKIRYQVETKAVGFDALDYSQHGSFYETLEKKPDVVVVVFGYLGDQELGQNDFSETEKIIHTNFTGAVSILNIIANDFEKRKSGTIIGISSVSGDRGRKSNYLYGSSKAGLTVYLSGLRNRLCGSGVHVMTVLPGFVRTKMTEEMDLPPLFTANPEQIAADIYKASAKGTNILYTLRRWKFVMFIIKSIPEFIFKKLSL